MILKMIAFGTSYFDNGWNKWGYIKEGDLLAIKYTESTTENKTHQAIEIVEIDRY